MALQGTLDTFALADLVRLLATTSKTGELVIDGDRGTGRLWFADGILVGGHPAGDGGSVDALFALLRFSEGSFAFEADIAAPEGSGPPGDAVALLTEAEERIEAWRPIEAVVPSPAVSLSLCAELVDDDVHLDRDQWRLVTTIAGGSTAAEVALAFDLDEIGAATRIKDLVDVGAIEVGREVAEAPAQPAAEATVAPAADLEVESDEPEGDDDEPVTVDGATSRADGQDLDAVFESVEVVDPLAEETAEEALDTLPPRPEVAGEPRPSLRALSRAELDADVPVNGRAGPGSLLSFDGAMDPPEIIPGEEPAAEAEAPTPMGDAGAGGSTQVDLDAILDTESDGHRYLGTTEGAEALPAGGPEALPVMPEPLGAQVADAESDEVDEIDDVDAVDESDETHEAHEIDDLDAVEPVDDVDDGDAVRAAWPTGTSDEDLAVQLDALSPAAARAVAAAASNGDVSDDSDAGRKVLRRIISSGRS